MLIVIRETTVRVIVIMTVTVTCTGLIVIFITTVSMSVSCVPIFDNDDRYRVPLLSVLKRLVRIVDVFVYC